MKSTYAQILLLLLITSPLLFAQQSLTGQVLDNEGIPLFGANIVIENSSEGTTTDENGAFQISTNRDFPFNLVVSYIGCGTQVIPVQNSSSISIFPQSDNLFDEVIISASRKAEKLQEAPSAVAVISGKSLSESGGSLTPLRSLINTPGVELQQQTGQRINVALLEDYIRTLTVED